MIELDITSLLVHVRADERLAAVEASLAKDALTLGIEIAADPTVGEWLDAGAPGARSAWLDPADHLLAGFSARTSKGSFSIQPAPRRAVGPDLASLVLGLRGRMLTLESVWLRVHRRDAPRAATEPFRDDTEALTKEESALLDAIHAELER